MKFNTALILATAGSLVAAQEPHRHGHRHLHRRDAAAAAATAVTTQVVYVYQLNGQDLPADEVCQGVQNGKYLWADGSAPAGACPTSAAAALSTSVAPAEFIETPSSSSSSSPSPTPATSSAASSTSTTLSTIAVTSSTSTSLSTIAVSSSTSTSLSTIAVTTSTVAATSSAVSISSPGTTNGGVTVKNTVGQTLYLWSTSQQAGDMVTLPNGQTYSENWQLNPDAGGISIKISTTPSLDDILQFEYTLITPIIWFDVSLINMATTSLFDQLGFSVTSDNSACYTVNCPAGETACSDAYLWPTDDQATHSCQSTSNMVLNLGAPL